MTGHLEWRRPGDPCPRFIRRHDPSGRRVRDFQTEQSTIRKNYTAYNEDNLRSTVAIATVCQTSGAVFHMTITSNSVSITVDLPFDTNLSEEEAEVLEANIHNVMELVLAPLFRSSASDIAAHTATDRRHDDPPD